MNIMIEKTLCWKCKNSVKCEWSKGKPIDDWNAEPVMITNKDGTKFKTFFVRDCPQFEQDDLIRVSYKEISEILGETREHNNRTLAQINVKLKDIGYEAMTHPSDGKLYLRKLKTNENQILL